MWDSAKQDGAREGAYLVIHLLGIIIYNKLGVWGKDTIRFVFCGLGSSEVACPQQAHV